jgi:hypothetical protein
MAQHMTPSVLGHEVSEIGTETHICDGRLSVPPLLDWEAFEENKALAIQQLLPHALQELGEVGKWEVGLGDTCQRNVVGYEVVGGIGDFSDLFGAEGMCPSFWIVLVVFGLPDRGTGDLSGEVGVGPQLVIERRMLTRCLDAIGIDVLGGGVVRRREEVRCLGGWRCEGWSHSCYSEGCSSSIETAKEG